MGSLTLAKDGNVLYSRSFGYSQINGNEKKPLTAETKHRIASITKTFTAVRIFQLVEEEKLCSVGLHCRKSGWQTVSGSLGRKNYFQDRAQEYLCRGREHGSPQKRSSFL